MPTIFESNVFALNGGHAIGRAFARPVGFAHPTELEHPVLLLPVSAELPSPDGLDLKGEAGFWRVWKALLVQRALPAMGLPGLTVSTDLIGTTPVGVGIVAGHFREDLCLLAGKAIEARGSPLAPIDPGG